MNRGHTVRAVRADDSQVGHANLALRLLLDQADAPDTILVVGKAGSNIIQQAAIDLKDELQMTRQQELEPCDRPFFQSFGQQGMVRVRQSTLRQVPSLVPTEMCFVEQNPHQLWDRHGRMCVVELNGDFIGEYAPVGITRLEAPYEIGQRAGNE